MNQYELMHSGVKGMRWGVRKARPSSGSGGGKKSGKAKAKAEAAARDTTTLTKSEEAAANLIATTLIRAKQRIEARNDTVKRVTEKAEKSARGVAMAKVPGRLEFMRARVTASHVDDKGATVADRYRLMYFNAGKTIKQTAALAAIAGTAAYTYRVRMT
nr:MAG TPA: hypothetical protein [Caudoviricetes sp.]